MDVRQVTSIMKSVGAGLAAVSVILLALAWLIGGSENPDAILPYAAAGAFFASALLCGLFSLILCDGWSGTILSVALYTLILLIISFLLENGEPIPNHTPMSGGMRFLWWGTADLLAIAVGIIPRFRHKHSRRHRSASYRGNVRKRYS